MCIELSLKIKSQSSHFAGLQDVRYSLQTLTCIHHVFRESTVANSTNMLGVQSPIATPDPPQSNYDSKSSHTPASPPIRCITHTSPSALRRPPGPPGPPGLPSYHHRARARLSHLAHLAALYACPYEPFPLRQAGDEPGRRTLYPRGARFRRTPLQVPVIALASPLLLPARSACPALVTATSLHPDPSLPLPFALPVPCPGHPHTRIHTPTSTNPSSPQSTPPSPRAPRPRRRTPARKHLHPAPHPPLPPRGAPRALF